MNWLGYSEEEVWKLTPRKWSALVHKHVELYKQQWGVSETDTFEETSTGYIDQVGI